MKRYLHVYIRLWKMSLQSLLIYRANFVNSLMASLSWGVFSVISILLLTSKTNTIYGWTKTEILLLTCAYQILIGVFHTLFSRNFERMAQIINLAELDSLLTKPLDSQFMLSMWQVNYTSMIRIVLGIIFVGYFTQTAAIHLNAGILFLFGLLLVIGIILLYSVWYIVATLIIWFPRMSNVIELMYTVSGISRYPGEMYRNALGLAFFFLLPITLIVTTPIRFLVAKVNVQDIFLLSAFALSFLFISRKFWKFALRFYTSASS